MQSKHKRINVAKKKEYLRAVKVPGSAENRDALRRERQIARELYRSRLQAARTQLDVLHAMHSQSTDLVSVDPMVVDSSVVADDANVVPKGLFRLTSKIQGKPGFPFFCCLFV